MKRRKERVEGFPAWIERTVHLPLGLAATPGPIKLAPYLREIAASMTDPAVERLSLVKASRIGYSTLVSALIGWHMVEDPAPVLVVVPAELDARNFVVSLEDIFETSPDLQGKLPTPATAGRASRNTLLFRRGTGGASLRLVGATAPRNLRAVTAKVLVCDESDALVSSVEGDPISLAEKRTLSYPDRKLIVGSTPLSAATSHVCRLFGESDMRVWQTACPHCRAYSEIIWEQIVWPKDKPEAAAWRCPNCEVLVTEKQAKAGARSGRWRPLRPEAPPTHRGYRISALSSTLANVSWPRLAMEYEQVKDDPDRLKVFHNTVLARAWDEGTAVDESALMARAESSLSLDALPAECLVLTMGVDCADDRLEAVICGWTKAGGCLVLAHEVIHGGIDDELTWRQLEDVLRMRWPHPLGRGGAGARLKIDAVAIDGGDGGHLAAVLAFCRSRSARRVMCIKGAPGFSRPPLLASRSKMRGGGRLWICGSDGIKLRIFDHLQRGTLIRFGDQLAPVFYEQLASERVVLKTLAGRPVRRFERIKGMKAEALDALAYSFAAKAALDFSPAAFALREDQLRSPVAAKPVPSIIRSQWMDR